MASVGDPANDPHNLNRFVLAQETDYAVALSEIKRGRKRSHWMWYIFPQLSGLGFSATSKRYSIKSVEEAVAYLCHPVLGRRLKECVEATLGNEGRSAHEIFGSPDDVKLQSCATLFACVSPNGSIFEQLLHKYFQGERDGNTLRLLGRGMKETTTPPIASHSIVLRHFAPEDAPKAYAMSQELGLRTWLPDQVYESEAGALDVLRYLIDACRDPGSPARGPYVLAVCAGSSMELIGHVGLSPVGGEALDRLGLVGHVHGNDRESEVEVGYAIEERHQGKGFASEAVGTMVNWALERFDLPRVLGIVATDNVASCRVLEHAGFALVRETRNRMHGRFGLIRIYQRARPAGAKTGNTIP